MKIVANKRNNSNEQIINKWQKHEQYKLKKKDKEQKIYNNKEIITNKAKPYNFEKQH